MERHIAHGLRTHLMLLSSHVLSILKVTTHHVRFERVVLCLRREITLVLLRVVQHPTLANHVESGLELLLLELVLVAASRSHDACGTLSWERVRLRLLLSWSEHDSILFADDSALCCLILIHYVLAQ